MRWHELTPGGPSVPELCLGTSPLGGMPDAYGYDVASDRAVATVRRALEVGLSFIDTSNEYGDGQSERRIGQALRDAGRQASSVVLASKADPIRGGALSGRRVLESFDKTLERLGTAYLDVYYLHDPERFEFSTLTAPGGAFETLLRLREEGRVGLVGVAGGDLEEARRYLDTGQLDVVLSHNQFTLLDQSATPLMDACVDGNTAFINAAPYASGMLAKPPEAHPRYQYRPPAPPVVEAVAWLRSTAADFGVPLAALALQFSTRDPRIQSTVVGISSPARVDELVKNAGHPVPDDLWGAVAEKLANWTPHDP